MKSHSKYVKKRVPINQLVSCFKNIRSELGWWVSCLATTVPSQAEKFLALGKEDIWHFTWCFRRSKRWTVTSQLNRYLVGFNHQFTLFTSALFRCLRLKLRRYNNRKEETAAEIIFLLTWAHERRNSNLAKDISRRRQHLRLLCNW